MCQQLINVPSKHELDRSKCLELAGFGTKSKQSLFIAAKLTGAKTGDAAATAGISMRTAYRWMNSVQFQMQLREVQKDVLERATSRLTAATMDAVCTLHSLLQDPMPTIRLRAAESIIDCGWKMRDQLDLVSRIAQLEKRADESEKANRET
jgi:hypothetical protein